MSRLVRLYAANFLENRAIFAAGDNLGNLNFDENNELSDENLGIGDDTKSWASLAELEAEHDPKPFSIWLQTKCYKSFRLEMLSCKTWEFYSLMNCSHTRSLLCSG